jgi:hypothetical protein
MLARQATAAGSPNGSPTLERDTWAARAESLLTLVQERL